MGDEGTLFFIWMKNSIFCMVLTFRNVCVAMVEVVEGELGLLARVERSDL